MIIKSVSIKKKLMTYFIVVIIIQGVLFSIAMVATGIFTKLEDNIIEITNKTVQNRTDNFENTMHQVSSKFLTSYGDYDKDINDFLVNNSIENINELAGNQELINGLMYSVLETLKYDSSLKSISGAFIVLDVSATGTDNKKAGLYIRNNSSEIIEDGKSQFILLRGSTDAFSKDIDASKDFLWEYEYNITDFPNSKYSFFQKPREAYQKKLGFTKSNTPITELSYWSELYKLSDYDREMITYTIPIAYKEQFLGVVGIELSVDYLTQLLPSDEISLDKHNSYILNLSNTNELSDNTLVSGALLKSEYDNLSKFTFKNTYRKINSLKEIFLDGKSAGYYAYVYDFNLYPSENYYYSVDNQLIGVIKKSTITKSSSNLVTMSLASIGISTWVGILFSIFISEEFSRPISNLSTRVRSLSKIHTEPLQRTRIFEIDNLSRTIENYSQDILNSSMNIKIFTELLDGEYAFFEYVEGQEKVFVTDSIFNIIPISKNDYISDYFEINTWNKIISQITQIKDERYEDVYRIESVNGAFKLIRIKIKEIDKKTVGFITEITQ